MISRCYPFPASKFQDDRRFEIFVRAASERPSPLGKEEVPMNHASIPAHPSRLSATVDALKALLRQIGSVVTALEHRREVKALGELDERTLRDIGLSRNDVEGALSEPFFRNPSLVLVRTVERSSHRPERPTRRPARPLVKAAG